MLTLGKNTVQLLAQRILHDAQSLGGSENMGQAYNVWPEPDMTMKFELRRLRPLTKVPVLGRQLLEGVSQMIAASFWDVRSSHIFDAFDGTISCFGQESFSFRAFLLPKAVALSEKMPGIDFGTQDLNAIFNIKLAILSYTTQDDLLIFVGNTGRYIIPAFSSADPLAYRRKVAFIPVSGLGGTWIDLWRRNGIPTETTTGNANFANTVLRPIFSNEALMPTKAGRIIFVDHARTGQSINSLSAEIENNDLVPFGDHRLKFLNLLYKTKHSPPVILWGATLLANILVDDEQMERLDLGTVGRVAPWYCSLYWEDNWEDIPYPDKPGAQGILDQVRARAADWATNPPPIPVLPSPTPEPEMPATDPGVPRPGESRSGPPISPFERLWAQRPRPSRPPPPGPPVSQFERLFGQRPGQSALPASPSGSASGSLRPA
ncbi:hypothetical protein MMC11_006435 [Xylographa trunciseda]|nr:hypothetical protein [Xylographa trunciseda]